MKKLLYSLAVATAGTGLVFAGGTATQQLNFQVGQVADIQLDDANLSFNIASIPFGNGAAGTDSKNSGYDISINYPGPSVITVSLDSDMPAGTTLSANVSAPTGGTGSTKTLSSTAATVVTGIVPVNQQAIAIAYTFSATVLAPTQPFSKTVTYTLIAH